VLLAVLGLAGWWFAPTLYLLATDQGRLVIETDDPDVDVIVKQGDPGDAFYIVRDGSVQVVVRKERSRRRIATLRAGDFFGEIALLNDAPRNATVQGLDAGSVWRLERQDFRDLLGRYLDLEGEIAGVAASRLPHGHSMGGAA